MNKILCVVFWNWLPKVYIELLNEYFQRKLLNCNICPIFPILWPEISMSIHLKRNAINQGKTSGEWNKDFFNASKSGMTYCVVL